MEREDFSSCKRALCALVCKALRSTLLLLVACTLCSQDPKGAAQLPGHCPRAHSGLSSFIVSQDATLRFVPTVFCKTLIFQ